MSSGLFRKIFDYQAGKTMALRGGMQILRSTNCINQGQLQYFGLQIISKMTSKMGGVGIRLWQIRYLIKRIQNLFEVTCEYSVVCLFFKVLQGIFNHFTEYLQASTAAMRQAISQHKIRQYIDQVQYDSHSCL